MSFLNSMLGVATGWSKIDYPPQFAAWIPDFLGALEIVLWVLLAIVGAAGGIYALYVGIKMARADSAEARDENKKRLINIIISIVVVIVLILFFNTFLPMILDAFGVFDKKDWVKDPNATAINMAKLFLHM